MVDEAKGERVTAEKRLADATGMVYEILKNFYGLTNYAVLLDRCNGDQNVCIEQPHPYKT